jgi:hypothetical protein
VFYFLLSEGQNFFNFAIHLSVTQAQSLTPLICCVREDVGIEVGRGVGRGVGTDVGRGEVDGEEDMSPLVIASLTSSLNGA